MEYLYPASGVGAGAACAILACIATGSALAKRMFPSTAPSATGSAVGVALLASAFLLVLPLGWTTNAVGAAGVLCVVAGGWALAMRRGAGETCDCFGAITPRGKSFHALMLLLAGGCATLVFVAAARTAVPGRSWLPPVLAIAGTLAMALVFRVVKYRRAFYLPGKLDGEVPEALAPDMPLGLVDGGELRIGEALGGSDVLLVVLLSSACESCHALLEGFRDLIAGGPAGFRVAFVSNHPRIFAGSAAPAGASFVVDANMSVARAVLARKLPVGFAVNDGLELLAPPSSGNAAILSLFSFLRDAKAAP